MTSPYESAQYASDLASFLDSEDIISKIHAIQSAEHRSPYRPFPQDANYWDRVDRATKHLPPEYQRAGLAVFASVIYITYDIRQETNRFLASSFRRWADEREVRVPEDLHVFAVDHPELVQNLYDSGSKYGWASYRDQKSQLAFPTTSALLRYLEQLVAASRTTTDPISSSEIKNIFSKRLWIVLNDNAFSGGSAKSDVERLLALLDIFDVNPRPELLIGAQIITKQAVEHLTSSLSLPPTHIIHGLLLDDRSRVCADECRLFSDPTLLTEVQELCRWFGNQHFSERTAANAADATDSPRNPRAANDMMRLTVEKHRNLGGDPDFSYGWLNGGYTVVDHRNAPTNSVPLLWYPANEPAASLGLDLYTPPFPRNHSRMDQITGGDSDRVDLLRETFRRTAPLPTEEARA